MRLPTRTAIVAGGVLAASLGWANLGQAAPLAGLAAAGSAVKMTQDPLAPEPAAEKAHYHRYHHHHYNRYHHYHPHYYHHY